MGEHRMIPGSHERRTGPACVCGGVWNYWNDKCEAVELRDWLNENYPKEGDGE